MPRDMDGRCERMQQLQGASKHTRHKAPPARVSISASWHVRSHRVQWSLAPPMIIKRVLPNGKQHLVGSNDMPKPPRGQESPVEAKKHPYVFQRRRLFLVEKKFQGSVIIPLNRLATLWGMQKHSITHLITLLKPHGGHHFDGMVTAARHCLALAYKFNDVDAST